MPVSPASTPEPPLPSSKPPISSSSAPVHAETTKNRTRSGSVPSAAVSLSAPRAAGRRHCLSSKNSSEKCPRRWWPWLSSPPAGGVRRSHPRFGHGHLHQGRHQRGRRRGRCPHRRTPPAGGELSHGHHRRGHFSLEFFEDRQ